MPALELSILIPTYNEAEIIEHTLKAIAGELGAELASKTEVLVVDDGTDELPAIVSKAAPQLPFARLETLRNNPPAGKGLSLARGFQKAQGKVVGFLDADLSTPASYIKPAFEAVRDGRADIYIGSRRSSDSVVEREQSMIKDVLGHLLWVAASNMIFSQGRHYRDTQCGFKFFRNSVAKVLYTDLVAYDGMTDIEILVRANLLGYRVHEQGVKWKDVRESKRRLSRIIVGDVKAIGRIVFNYRLFGANRIHKLKAAAEKAS